MEYDPEAAFTPSPRHVLTQAMRADAATRRSGPCVLGFALSGAVPPISRGAPDLRALDAFVVSESRAVAALEARAHHLVAHFYEPGDDVALFRADPAQWAYLWGVIWWLQVMFGDFDARKTLGARLFGRGAVAWSVERVRMMREALGVIVGVRVRVLSQ